MSVSQTVSSIPSTPISRFGVLYNEKYGGQLRISQEALDEYNAHRKMMDANACVVTFPEIDNYISYRSDPVLIKIYKRIGYRFSANPNSTVRLVYIPEKYRNFYVVTAMDGGECVDIDYDAYIVTQVKDIMENSQLNGEEKLAYIQDALKYDYVNWSNAELWDYLQDEDTISEKENDDLYLSDLSNSECGVFDNEDNFHECFSEKENDPDEVHHAYMNWRNSRI